MKQMGKRCNLCMGNTRLWLIGYNRLADNSPCHVMAVLFVCCRYHPVW